MARLPNVTRDMVPEEFREAYDEVTGGSFPAEVWRRFMTEAVR